jgi:spermidine synthase
MKAWLTLDRAVAPDGEELVLQQRGSDFAIRAGGQLLMASGATRSEQALAELACRGLRPAARVVVGGLGLGYTLRAALDALGPKAQVTVVELVPAVVRWNRGALGSLAGHPLADPRVEVIEGDVRAAWTEPGALDAILLDVDNGPRALTRPGNAALYGLGALREARAALRPGGALAVWSAGAAPDFLVRLKEAGFWATSHGLPRSQHVVLMGTVRPRGRGRAEPLESRPRRGKGGDL